MRELGLRFQLQHNTRLCPHPGYRRRKLVVCDLTGYHEVDVSFCECYEPNIGFVPRWKQLFRERWYPATRERPATVFTFRLLDFFLELTHQGKSNLYDFERTLDRVTDNSGSVAGWVRRPVPQRCSSVADDRTQNRYRQLSDSVRQWRNLTILKRSGRGHDPAGVNATAEGECAVECAACPHPERNLPANWQTAPADVAYASVTQNDAYMLIVSERRWMYILVLSLDANFKLKLKDREFDNVDLTKGWSYFVNETKYQGFISQYGDQTEASTIFLLYQTEGSFGRAGQCMFSRAQGYSKSQRFTTWVSSNRCRGMSLCPPRSYPQERCCGFAEGGEVRTLYYPRPLLLII